MQHYAMEWLTLVAAFSLAVLSPGPDFVVAVRNALRHGRSTGVWTAIGFGLGTGVHVTYTLLGLAALIAQSILVFTIVKYIGAAYLIYMGVKALRSQGVQSDPLAGQNNAGTGNALSPFAALRQGFITNLFNPKASLFFLALFTQLVHADTPHLVQALFGLTCIVMVMSWFSAVSFLLTTPALRSRFLRASKTIDRLCGAVFIALGLKLALTRAPG